MKKKILSFILAVAFILPCAIMLSACAKDERSIAVFYGKDDITEHGTTIWVNSTDTLSFEDKITVKVVMKDGKTNTIEMKDGKKSGYIVESTIPSDALVAGETYTYTISYKDFNTVTITIAVRKLSNTVNFNGKIKNRDYDGTATTLTVDDIIAPNKANATIKWFKKQADGSYVEMSTNPVNAGSYLVRVSIPAADGYEAENAEEKFTIRKATPTFEAPSVELTAGVGDTLADVELPAGFTWVDTSIAFNRVGTSVCDAIYTPEDTENYKQVPVQFTVTVEKATPEHTTIEPKQVQFETLLHSITLPTEQNGSWAWEIDNDILTVGEVGERSFVAVFTPNDTENYRVVRQSVKITVTPKLFEKPTLVGSYVYTGEEQTANLTNIVDGLNVSGDKRTNATTDRGTIIRIRLNDKNNYAWSDNTTEDVEISWIIEKATPEYTAPAVDGIYDVDGDLYDIELPEHYSWAADQTLRAGINNYDITFTPTDTTNYKTITNIQVSVDARKFVSVPTGVEYDYDGEAKLVELTGFDAETMEYVTAEADRTQTEAGEYQVVVRLKNTETTCWADKTVADKTINWKINETTPVRNCPATITVNGTNYNFRLGGTGNNYGDLTKEDDLVYSITISSEATSIRVSVNKSFEDLSYCVMDEESYNELTTAASDEDFDAILMNVFQPTPDQAADVPLQFTDGVATLYILMEGATRTNLNAAIVKICIEQV